MSHVVENHVELNGNDQIKDTAVLKLERFVLEQIPVVESQLPTKQFTSSTTHTFFVLMQPAIGSHVHVRQIRVTKTHITKLRRYRDHAKVSCRRAYFCSIHLY